MGLYASPCRCLVRETAWIEAGGNRGRKRGLLDMRRDLTYKCSAWRGDGVATMVKGLPKVPSSRLPGDATVRSKGPVSVSHYYEKSGALSVKRWMDRLGMTERQLAEAIGVSLAAIKQLPPRASRSKVAVRTGEMIEIVHRIMAWAGGERQALAWYRAEPIPAFGGRTAESLVKEGRAAAVRDYLDHVATGGFA